MLNSKSIILTERSPGNKSTVFPNERFFLKQTPGSEIFVKAHLPKNVQKTVFR